MSAIPLIKEEFIHKIDQQILKDRDLAETIALGCQQVARSVCFVHYWAFNALWITFNCQKSTTGKLTMKQLLE